MKLYFDPKIVEKNKNINKNIENTLFEKCDIFKDQNTLSIHILSIISILPICSVLLASIQHCYERLKKYFKSLIFAIFFDIYFIIVNLKVNNVNLKLL